MLAHGAADGVISVMQGGKFGHGFVSNAVSEAFSPVISDISDEYAQGLVASLVGGTASAASGGKFADGFVSAGVGYAFNKLRHSAEQESGFGNVDDPARYHESGPKYVPDGGRSEAVLSEKTFKTEVATARSAFTDFEKEYLALADIEELRGVMIRLGARQFKYSIPVAAPFIAEITFNALQAQPGWSFSADFHTHPRGRGAERFSKTDLDNRSINNYLRTPGGKFLFAPVGEAGSRAGISNHCVSKSCFERVSK